MHERARSALRRGENISRRATGVAADIISIVRQLRAAESRADFIHKVGIACKEFRETIYWLNLIEQGLAEPAGVARAAAKPSSSQRSSWPRAEPHAPAANPNRQRPSMAPQTSGICLLPVACCLLIN